MQVNHLIPNFALKVAIDDLDETVRNASLAALNKDDVQNMNHDISGVDLAVMKPRELKRNAGRVNTPPRKRLQPASFWPIDPIRAKTK